MRKIALQAMLIALVAVWTTRAAYAQNRTVVQGTVRDEKGNALGGATVAEKGHPTNVAVTDTSGHFVLPMKGSSKEIVVSFVGYEDYKTKATDAELTISLKPSKSNMGDVVVIGYQGMRRRNLTAAVSSLKGKDI